jgi:DNA-binding response OmpR family regulator
VTIVRPVGINISERHEVSGRALTIGGGAELPRLLAAAPGRPRLELLAAADATSGLRAFYAERPDVVVLHRALADGDGLEVMATIRELSDVPILVVSEDDEEAERVRILRAGADDCVAGGVGAAEMLARIEVLLRRPRAGEAPRALNDDFLHIDRASHRVEVLGVEVELTPTEFRMLATFAENPGRVLGHGQLLEMVWGDVMRGRDEVKLYVSYLRRKLGAAARVDPVETVRGIGYRYRPRRLSGQGA